MRLVRIDNASDKSLIMEYINMYLDLINIHYEQAALLGIYDEVCDKKTKEDAIGRLNNPKYKIELLVDKAEVIGYVRYRSDDTKTQEMIVNEETEGVCIDQLYVKEAWRSNGYGKFVIDKLKESYKKLSLDCYYGLEANKFYQKMGFIPVVTTYLSWSS
ncbi:GNAT family N-acetyltransferase [Lacrimispora amygdalina]|uniref:GNAT family N-acetyltransferase n=1 Tax=Lacrimispora amygdalina TaxID=253257 RepID=UPI000BE33480|nr:GNAT family N-acetyltransferase [Lacrimispora amygdalina]